MCDIHKVKADATFIQLRIVEITIIHHVLIFILYPIIIFLLWQELTYHFPYGQKGVRPSLIIDKAILMAAEQQHHLWCWTHKPWSLAFPLMAGGQIKASNTQVSLLFLAVRAQPGISPKLTNASPLQAQGHNVIPGKTHVLQETGEPMCVLLLLTQQLEWKWRAAQWEAQWNLPASNIVLGQQLSARVEMDCSTNKMILFLKVTGLPDNQQKAVRIACCCSDAYSTRHSSYCGQIIVTSYSLCPRLLPLNTALNAAWTVVLSRDSELL